MEDFFYNFRSENETAASGERESSRTSIDSVSRGSVARLNNKSVSDHNQSVSTKRKSKGTSMDRTSKSSFKYSTKKCEDDDEDPYSVDFSMLKNLPKSLILEAIEYAKAKRKEEEEKEREKDDFKRLKCIPPWAKTYGGVKKAETCVTTGTQFEMPSYIKLEELELEEEEIDEFEGDESDIVITDTKKIMKKKPKYLSVDDVDDVDITYERKLPTNQEMDSVSMKSGSTNVGVQIQPSTAQFGMQTGHDSLTTVTTPVSDLGLSLSQTLALTDDERRQLQTKGVLDDEYVTGRMKGTLDDEYYMDQMKEALDDAYLAGLTSEERLKIVGKGRPKDRQLLHDKIDQFGETEGEAEEEMKEEAAVETLSEEGEECLEEQELEEEEGVFVKKKKKFTGKDSNYLKERFGQILPKILAEVAWKRPADPVHYLAHRLYCERNQQQVREQMICMRASLKDERESMMLPSGEMEPIKTFGFFDRNLQGIIMDNDYDQLLEEEESEEEEEEQEKENDQQTDEEPEIGL